MHLFCIICISFLFFHWDLPGWTRIMKMWLKKSIAEHSAKRFCEISIFPIKNFNFPFILFKTFSTIGALDIVTCNMHPRHVTSECCFIFLCLCLIFSWRKFFDLRFLPKRIDIVMSSPKRILSLLSTTQSHIFSKSLLSWFSISSTSLCWYKMHESWMLYLSGGFGSLIRRDFAKFNGCYASKYCCIQLLWN